MKKAIIVLAMVFIPVTAFAGLDIISDNDMASITGEVGSTVLMYIREDPSLSTASLGNKTSNLSNAFFAARQLASHGVDDINILNSTLNLTPSATLSTEGMLYSRQIPVVIGTGGNAMSIMGQTTSVTQPSNPWPVIGLTFSTFSNMSTMVNGMNMMNVMNMIPR